MPDLPPTPDDAQSTVDLFTRVMGLPTLNDIGLVLVVHDLGSDVVRLVSADPHLPFPKEFSFLSLLARLPPGESEKMRLANNRAAGGGGVQRFVLRLPLPGDQHYWLSATTRHYASAAGPGFIVATLQHITEAREAELALMESEAKLRAVVDHSEDAITIRDRAGRHLLVNPSAAHLLGRSAEALLGQTIATLGLNERVTAALEAAEQAVISSATPQQSEWSWPPEQPRTVVSVSQFPFWQRGQVEGTVSIARDISALKALERELRDYASTLEARVQERTLELSTLMGQLRHAAYHDELTGLPNRKLFMEEVQRHIETAAPFSVLFCDSDQFKLVNDGLGHLTGDELLRLMARRLQEHAPPGALVARYGGDEFLLLLGGAHGDEALLRLSSELAEAFHRPFRVAGQEVRLTISIGATQGRWGYTSAAEAVRDADIAMYRAKGRHRGSAALFEPQMRERQVRLLALQNDLARALERGELRVHYQPVLRAAKREVGQIQPGQTQPDIQPGRMQPSGVEALVRWQHPQHGLIPPGDFIGAAEAGGLICELDLWVLRRACTDLMTLPGGPCGLGVNFSAQHFEQPGLPERIGQVLAETGFPARLLTAEITEQLLLRDDALVSAALRHLRHLGVLVAIDDFGTGYSALSYIRRFPLDIVKVDRAFISEVTCDPAIVRSIVQMARSLELRVVAEGVETAEQQQALIDLGCDWMQGYFYARPLSLPQLTEWLGHPLP